MGFSLKKAFGAVMPTFGLANAGLGSLGGLGGGGDNSTSNAPWIGQQPYLRDLWSNAKNLYSSPDPYGSDAMNMRADRAMAGSPLNQAAQAGLLNTLNGSFLPGGESFQQQMDAIGRAIRPSLDSQFASAGRYGSGLHKIGMEQRMTDAGLGLMNAERGRQMQAFGMAPQLAAQDYYDIDQLNQASQYPWQRLNNYQNVVGGQMFGTTQTTPKSNPLPALLGAGAGMFFGGMPGASLGASLGGMFS